METKISIFDASNQLAFLAQAPAERNRHASGLDEVYRVVIYRSELGSAVPNLELWVDKASNPQANRLQEEGNKGSVRQLTEPLATASEALKGQAVTAWEG